MPPFKDITGQTFGSRTVIDCAGTRNRVVYWNCVCVCGKRNQVNGTTLRNGQAHHCDTCRTFQNVEGQKFHLLTAVKFVKIGKHQNRIWKFQCDCGKIKNYQLSDVKRGEYKSCGCLAKIAKLTHGKILSATNRRASLLNIDRKEAYQQEKAHREAIASGVFELDPTEQLEVEQKLEAARTDVIPPWAKGN